MAKGEGESAKSIKRALNILLSFTRDCREQRLTEIAKRVKLPVSTTARIISVLSEMGFLQKEESSKTYRLGPALCYLGVIAKEGIKLREVALPFMRRLRDKYKETVNLYVLEGNHRVCIEQVESPLPLKRSAKLGDRLPLWAGATGRCFLAFMDGEEVERILSELKPLTSNTILDKKEIYRRLEKVRALGYEISNAEREEGVASVSSPIFDASGKVVACLTVSGPSFRITKKIDELAEAVSHYAREISKELGFSPPSSPSERG